MTHSPQKTTPIIVTRPKTIDMTDNANDKLCTLLSELSSEVYHLPLVSLKLLSKPFSSLTLEPFGWVIFTSTQAVHLFFKSPLSKTIQPSSPPHFAVVGEATHQALKGYGHQVKLTPDHFMADALADTLLTELDDDKPEQILWPCNQNHDATLPNAFKASPHTLTPYPLYESIPKASLIESEPQIWSSLLGNPKTIIIFTSPSATLGAKQCGLTLVKHRIVSIGHNTTQACHEHLGNDVSLDLTEASPHSFQGVLQAIQTL